MKRLIIALTFALACHSIVVAQDTTSQTPAAAPAVAPAAPNSDAIADLRIPINSKVFLRPVEGSEGFESYLAAALRKKKVPLVMVTDRDMADFEISMTSETKKAGWAKTIFGSGKSEESAAITVTNLKTGVVAFADSSHRSDALRGKRSTAEKLAKYLGKKMQEDAKLAAKLQPK